MRKNSTIFRSHEKVFNGEFHKTVTRQKHLFRRDTSYGIDAAQLEYFKENSVNQIYIHETDTGETWQISTATFAGFCYPASFGFGEQVLCRLTHFRRAGEERAAQIELLPRG